MSEHILPILLLLLNAHLLTPTTLILLYPGFNHLLILSPTRSYSLCPTLPIGVFLRLYFMYGILHVLLLGQQVLKHHVAHEIHV